MSSTEEYLDNVAECVRMAQVTKDEGDRHTWLKMAAAWVHKAKLSLRQPVERSSKPGAESSVPKDAAPGHQPSQFTEAGPAAAPAVAAPDI
jgi:hypothetical protein